MRKLLLILILFSFVKSDAQSPMFKLAAKKSGGGNDLLDTYPGASRAYSLRKLRNAYSGNCIKIRRSSDDAEQDIGFSSGVVDTASIISFVGANSAYVTTWYDQSTAAQNATQTTNANQPRIINSGTIDRVNGLPSLYFNGTFNFLVLANVSTANGVDWSSFMVQKRGSSGGNGFMFAGGNSAAVSPVQFFNGNLLMRRVGASDHVFTNQVADATATFSLIEGYVASGVSTAYKDGSAYSLGSAVDDGVFGDAFFNNIGRYFSFLSSGHLSEAIFYPSDQSANRLGIETNVNNFYSVIPITYLADDFTGTDGTNLTAHTMNTGSGWTSQVDGLCSVNSIMTIQSNKAQNTSGFLQLYTANAGVSDYVATMDLTVPNTSDYAGGILFRFSSCGNWYAIDVERDGGGTPYMCILESNGGTRTVRATVNVPAATNSTLNIKVTLVGNSIVALAGTGETCNYTSSLFASSTLVGLFGYEGGGYTPIPMDNFLVTNM